MIEQRGEVWVRWCGKCGKEIIHSGKYAKGSARVSAERGRVCKSCGAFRGSGKDNPFFGKKHSEEAKAATSVARRNREASLSNDERLAFSEKMKEVYSTHHAGKTRLSVEAYWRLKYEPEIVAGLMQQWRTRESIAATGEGNPMFGRPAPAKSGTGWGGWLDGTYFRSLRELNFMLMNPCAQTAEGAEWRALFNWSGRKRTTVADFLLPDSRVIVECKPERLHSTPLVQAKAAALGRLAVSRGWTFLLIDPGIPDSDEITKLVANERIQFTEKSKEKFDDWNNSCA